MYMSLLIVWKSVYTGALPFLMLAANGVDDVWKSPFTFISQCWYVIHFLENRKGPLWSFLANIHYLAHCQRKWFGPNNRNTGHSTVQQHRKLPPLKCPLSWINTSLKQFSTKTEHYIIHEGRIRTQLVLERCT